MLAHKPYGEISTNWPKPINCGATMAAQRLPPVRRTPLITRGKFLTKMKKRKSPWPWFSTFLTVPHCLLILALRQKPSLAL
ncbi:Uncharacterised protein [Vibrio cholerae]|nr:Uncharacterised protein [Vibrio cholerae]